MVPLKVSIVQAPLVWHNAQANLDYFSKQISSHDPSDLWVLPEMFNSGFSMQADKIAEDMNGPSIRWMKEIALKQQTNVLGSLAIVEDGKYFNRLILAKENGDLNYYDKRHLFAMAGEQLTYSPGQSHSIVSLKGWKIQLQVCYDLRFPVFSRNNIKQPYDLLVYVANWPNSRIYAWDSLLVARAIENQAYVIGVNRIGEDHNQLRYDGHSKIIDPMGKIMADAGETEGVLSAQLDRDNLFEIRQKLPFLKDADHFQLLPKDIPE